MRKTRFSPIDNSSAAPGHDWLDLDQAARVEVSSEAEGYPVEGALLNDVRGGWRAASQAVRPFACFSISRRQFESFAWFSKKESSPRQRSSCCDGCRREHATGKMSSGSSGTSAHRSPRTKAKNTR